MQKKKLPKVIEGLCIGCGHCIMACPLGALKLVNKKSKVINPEACDSEGRCIESLPAESNTAFRRTGVLINKRS